MSKHTPGPWAIDGNEITATDHEQTARVATIDNTRTTGWSKPVVRANARLVAASPDLLDALREAVEIIESTGLDAGMQRAAIQKATEG